MKKVAFTKLLRNLRFELGSFAVMNGLTLSALKTKVDISKLLLLLAGRLVADQKSFPEQQQQTSRIPRILAAASALAAANLSN